MRGRSSLRIALLFLLVSPALYGANDKRHEPVGRMIGSPSVMEWQPAIDHERLVLTVKTPDEEIFSREFPAGRNPSYRLQDHPGPRGAVDGEYTYEIRVVPRISPLVRQRLEAAREANDDATIARIRREAGIDRTVVQSGTFSVLNGRFLDPETPEPTNKGGSGLVAGNDSRNESSGGSNGNGSDSGPVDSYVRLRPVVNDQVIPDDLIVQASLCTGFDCVDGESFGVDTIRLKENNLRIHFEDTSTSAGFASNDWRIFANEQPSGGANKFYIEDSTNARIPFAIEAVSPTNSVYIDSTGKIGFRNSAPGLDLHMTTSDTPAVRFEQTNSGGFTAQTWDIGANEANFFVRDLTGGSKLSFRIRPGAPTSSIDIAADGKVGIATGSPQHLLDVRKNGSSTALGARIYNEGTTATDDAYLIFETHLSRRVFTGLDRSTGLYTIAGTAGFGTQSWVTVDLLNGNVGLGNVTNPTNPIQHSSGAVLTAGGTWTNASSREYKRNITELDATEAQCALEQLNPVKFAYKTNGERHVGFIAEDVPDLVATSDRKGLSSLDIVAVLTSVVKEQQKTIAELTKRIEQLENQN